MSLRAIKWVLEAGQRTRMSSVQRLVLLTLAYHHNDRTNQCNPAVDTLAAETGLSARTVQFATRELAASGLITVATRTVHGIQTSNQYDLFGTPKMSSTPRRERPSTKSNGMHHRSPPGCTPVHPGG
jgi:DNA-binding transcriptional MocR family regulator